MSPHVGPNDLEYIIQQTRMQGKIITQNVVNIHHSLHITSWVYFDLSYFTTLVVCTVSLWNEGLLPHYPNILGALTLCFTSK